MEIGDAKPGEMTAVAELFREYAKWLGVDLEFQRFERELAELPGCYALPQGRLLVARAPAELAGCVALRPLEGDICEMKRLFVRRSYRGGGLGRRLVERILEEGRVIGYQKMRLDTLAHMTEAITLYRSVGFSNVPPYYPNPLPDVLYFELDLTRPTLS